MLTENDVVAHVANHLRASGYRIDAELRTDEHGIDVDAVHPRRRQRVLIEAKGETSSKKDTARFGAPFTRAQCKTHLAVALLAVVRLRDQYGHSPRTRVALALPDLEPHLTLAKTIRRSLRTLGVGLFWVSTTGRVRLDSPWRL